MFTQNRTKLSTFQDIKQVQQNILTILNDFQKLRPLYQFGIFDDPDRFYNTFFKNVERPLMQNLKRLCQREINSPVQLAYFIFNYQHCLDAYQENDSKQCCSSVIEKISRDRKLELTLKDHAEEVCGFYANIRQLRDKVDAQINLLTLMYYKIQGFEYAKWLTGNFNLVSIKKCVQGFHCAQIEELKRKLNDPDFQQLDENEESLDSLTAKIFYFRMARLELDAANLVLQNRLGEFSKDQLIIYLIQREILRHFKECLLFEEKDFFWKWFIRASLINSKQKQFTEVYDVTKQLYSQSENFGFSSLLNNDTLLRKINENMEEVTVIDANEIKDIFSNQMKTSHALKKLLTDPQWNFLASYDEFNWSKKLKTFVNTALIQPLTLLSKLHMPNIKFSGMLPLLYGTSEKVIFEVQELEPKRALFPLISDRESASDFGKRNYGMKSKRE